MFKKATKNQQKLRLLLEGASGSGKTFSSLILAKSLGKKIAVIDTEKGSASLYAGKFDFDVCELKPPYTPESYIEAIKGAEQAGYEVLIIDSITHEWNGQGGCLDIHSQLGGRFQDWAKVTPRHNKFVESILQSGCHIVATARTKSDYEMSESNGKKKVEKIGLKTEQRDGLDYEFTVVFRVNENHLATATKDRTSLFTGLDEIITAKTGEKLLNWLNDGTPAPVNERKSFAETHSPAVASATVEDYTSNASEQLFNDMGKNENFITSGQVANFCIRQQELMISDAAVKKMLEEKGFSTSGSRKEILSSKFMEAKKALEELGKKVNGNQTKIGV